MYFIYAPGRPTTIFGSHIVLHCSSLSCGIHSMYRYFPEARAQRLLVCGRALLAEARIRSNTIVMIFNSTSSYIISHINRLSYKCLTLTLSRSSSERLAVNVADLPSSNSSPSSFCFFDRLHFFRNAVT